MKMVELKDEVYEIYRDLCFESLVGELEKGREEGKLEVFGIVSGIPKLYRWGREEKVLLDGGNRDFFIDLCFNLKNWREKKDRVKGLYLEGRGHTGKSMAAGILCKSFYVGNKFELSDLIIYRSHCWWWDYMYLLDKKRLKDRRWEEFIDWTFRKMKFLVIDDFGRDYARGEEGDFSSVFTTSVIKQFIESGGILVVTGNLPYREVGSLFGKKLEMLFKEFLVPVEFSFVHSLEDRR